VVSSFFYDREAKEKQSSSSVIGVRDRGGGIFEKNDPVAILKKDLRKGEREKRSPSFAIFSLGSFVTRSGRRRSHNDGKNSKQQAEQEKEEEVTIEMEKEEGVPSYTASNVKDAFGRVAGVRACVLRACEGLYTHEHARRRANACVVCMREKEKENVCDKEEECVCMHA